VGPSAAPAATDPTPEEAHFYRLPAALDPMTLRRYFTLHGADREEVGRCRGVANALGFAVQLCTLRWRGHFLRDMAGVPSAIVETLAEQAGFLSLALVVSLQGYPASEDTRLDHHERIRRHLGFTRCGAAERGRLFDHMVATAQTVPRAATLYPLSCRWLLEQRIVRPGPSTIYDILARARERALVATFETLVAGLTPDACEQLDQLLLSPAPAEGQAVSTRSRLDAFRLPAAGASAATLVALTVRLDELSRLGFARWPALQAVHPATRRLLAGWGYAYDAWSLRRFEPAKRRAILLCTVEAAFAEAADALVEMQDKLITRVHNRARKHRADLLHATDAAKARAVSLLEDLGGLVLDEPGVPDADLRARIYARHPREEISLLVEGCRGLREGDPGSYLGFIGRWHAATRQYSPALLDAAPLCFPPGSELGLAVEHLRQVNRDGRRKLGADAPLGFLPPRWRRHVLGPIASAGEERAISRPHYEAALLSTLNERIKSGDVTVEGSRRWADFDNYLIAQPAWAAERLDHYALLGLPTDPAEFVAGLDRELKEVTEAVEARLASNAAVTIDARRGRFKLARPRRGGDEDDEQSPRAAETPLGKLIRRRLPKTDLADVLIDVDNETDFVRHLLGAKGGRDRTAAGLKRRNVFAALLACGCNLGPERMAAATPGTTAHEIAEAADWLLTEDALKAAVIELVNYASRLPLSQIWGLGSTASSDGMRFHVPANILSADYSPLLADRGVTLMRHTLDNYLQLHGKPVPCRLREALFSLDGLVEHDTELDPRVLYTDTHGSTEVVMAAGHLLGFSLEPRIADLGDQTLYKIDREVAYPGLDPILTGTVKTHLIGPVWDGVVRLVASMRARTASPSLILHRLGSYARQNSLHQALAEIGRIRKTVFVLRFLNDAGYRRHIGQELNKGERSHVLSRFLFFGKEGAVRGRTFQDQVNTFSCLAVLHNAVVVWNTLRIGEVVAQLRAEGHMITDEDLARTSPLLHAHINPFGQYRFDLDRMRRA
jgi:TnpA family transposase